MASPSSEIGGYLRPPELLSSSNLNRHQPVWDPDQHPYYGTLIRERCRSLPNRAFSGSASNRAANIHRVDLFPNDAE